MYNETNSKIIRFRQDWFKIDKNIKKLELEDYDGKNLIGMPNDFPMLEFLRIKGGKLESLKGFSQNIPNLFRLFIENTQIKTLDHLPQTFNSLNSLYITYNNLETLIGFPQKLPSLSSLYIIENTLPSLKGMPKSLPKLYNFTLACKKLKNFEGFPTNVPYLRGFDIGMTQHQQAFTEFIPLQFESFKGLPQSMQKLYDFTVIKATLRNLANFPLETPELDEIRFENCTLNNLIGLATLSEKTYVKFHGCTLYSFEGFSQKNNEFFRILLWNTTIYSLAYIPKKYFQDLLVRFYSGVGNKSNTLKLTKKGQKLVKDCLNMEVYNRYVPREINGSFSMYQCSGRPGYDESVAEGDPEEWIYGYHLENRLFYPEKIKLLYEYYKKNPLELAFQYKDAPTSLTDDELERLIHEADYRVLKLLEPVMPPDDSVVAKILRKNTFLISNGLKILK